MSAQRPIRLLDAVKYTKNEPHQLAAWNWLESQLTPAQLSEFALIFRAAPNAKPGPNAVNSWDGVIAAAQRAGAKYPELVAAQWALESNWGKHAPGHNYFGLKGKGQTLQTQEVYDGQRVDVHDEFLVFASLDLCVQHLVDRWYKDYKHYKGVNNAPDRNAAAQQLQGEGYATDPSYAQKLIGLMDRNAPISRLPGPVAHPNPLRVPYYSQRDSQAPGQAMRMCFSSANAMLVAALRPNALKGTNADDAFLAVVRQFGDTTDATAQLRALRHFGITARFTQTADWADIERQIQRGVPVPVGILHHGPVSAPSGGGHWITVIGYTPTAMIVHDPFGELDLINGGYTSSKGAGLAYSRKNLGPRLMVEGPRSAWAILAEP